MQLRGCGEGCGWANHFSVHTRKEPMSLSVGHTLRNIQHQKVIDYTYTRKNQQSYLILSKHIHTEWGTLFNYIASPDGRPDEPDGHWRGTRGSCAAAKGGRVRRTGGRAHTSRQEDVELAQDAVLRDVVSGSVT